MRKQSGNRPFCIGVYFNRKNKASREQVAGIFRFAGEHPEWELHLFTRPDTPAEMQRLTASFTPDGIITGHPAIVQAFDKRFGRNIPCVLIDYAASSSTTSNALVLCNDHAIGELAASTFLKRGYTSFAFAGIRGDSGDSDAVNSKNRENGFRRALQKAGFGCAIYNEQLDLNNLHYKDVSKLRAWLKTLPKPCILMAHSDFLAQSILTTCRTMHIAIPEQVAIIGVDNEESICESTTPKLSSIEPDFAGGGYLAADMLNQILLRDKRPPGPLRKTYGILRIEERMSTQNVSGTHLRVAKALEIIREDGLRDIRTAEIATRLNISERMLELSFRKTLGHSIREELLAFRLDKVQHMLKSTSAPLGKVAASCGFRTLSALKAIFRKRAGCSMRTYRQMAHQTATRSPPCSG